MPQENSNDNSINKDMAALSDMALQHYQEGHLQQARDKCLRILRKQQRPDAILILGKIAHEQREFEVAVERYQQFLGLMPNHAQTHFNLGVVLEELGRMEPAIEHYKKSISIAADNAAVHRQLGDAYTKLKRSDEAIKTYQQVLANQAEDVVTTIKLGNAFLAAGRLTESILLYEQALTILPDDGLLHRHLGVSLQRMGQMKKAIQSFEQALNLRPDDVDLRIDLARVLRQLGRAEEALVPLEEAIDLEPNDGEAHISLALTLRQLGQTDLAIERLEEFISAKPTCGSAYYQISMMKPKQELIPVVQKVVSDPKLPNSDAIYCHFALGNFFDSGRSYDQAFRHFLRANTLQRKTFTYDANENKQIVNSLIEVYSKGFFQSKRQFGSASQLPVFIVGMPRSGTTVTEQIISSHTEAHGAGEIEALPAINHSIAQQLNHAKPHPECLSLIDRKMAEEYSAQYLQELTHHCPTAARIIDKQPGNFVRIGLIKTLFPDARIIHCQRQLYLVIFSLFQAIYVLLRADGVGTILPGLSAHNVPLAKPFPRRDIYGEI
jgi:tetratricopeptide (TPR) repeat protein